MKSTTNIHIAIRNIGDSQDRGQTFEGTLSESILWQAQILAKLSMAGRIVIGLGRTHEDALRGIDVKSAGKSAVSDDMKAMLDSVFNAEANESALDDSAPALNTHTQAGVERPENSNGSAERLAGDTYVAP